MRISSYLKMLLLGGCVLFLQPVFGTSITVTGNVSGTWDVDTVRVMGDLFVPSGETLVIEPGVRVLFYGSYQVTVKGRVVAIGTESSLIRFNVSDTTGFSDTLTAAGGWHGFVYEHLLSSEDSSIYQYCRFEHGKAFSTDTMGLYGGAFRLFDFGKISFLNCSFAHNFAIRSGGAIYGKNAGVTIKKCEFFQNYCGLSVFPYGYGGGYCSVHSSPVVTGNHFIGNRTTGVGGGASFEYSNPELTHNVFRENYAGLGGGFGFLRSEAGKVVSNNLVQGNEARFFGGGISCIRAFTVFSNMTIVNNLSSMGGGFYCNDSAAPTLYNSILTENSGFGNEVYIWDFLSAPNFYYCDVTGGPAGFEGSGGQQGYHGIYQNNLDTIVLFSGTGQFPWALQPVSPCRDAGTPDTSGLQVPPADLAGENRIYNERIDIGAYEYNPGEGITERHGETILMKIYPNPSSESVHIEFLNTTSNVITLSIFSLDGRLVKEFHPVNTEKNMHKTTWNTTDEDGFRVSPGCYIIHAEGSDHTFGSGMVIIRATE